MQLKIPNSSLLNHEAVLLLKDALKSFDEFYGAGAMSCAIYDTAWVSMVTKPDTGARIWLFPESFRVLMEEQNTDGSWSSAASQIDGILNTAAGLLSLVRHAAEPLQIAISGEDLVGRIELATASLKHQLDAWDVSLTLHVGYEIILPSLLRLLKEAGVEIGQWRGEDELMAVHAAKMSRFKPEFLYGKTQLTALHSLESFVGLIDFDKVTHHRYHGAIMSSPSATAAFLMNLSAWDDEAEQYLRNVVARGPGNGRGGVPSAFPSTNFEYTWILSTLIQAGFTADDLKSPELEKMASIIYRSLKESGTIGFSPGIEADVDDTAKALICLGSLGYSTPIDGMIKAFECETHFQTYPKERDPSFSANCNALLALLCQADLSSFSAQILKVVRFLSETWWNTDGPIKDKWNLCHLYPTMLMTEAFIRLLAIIDEGRLPSDFLAEELRSKVAIAVFQAGLRTMTEQKEDGSWSQSVEQTSYAVLILSESRRLRHFEFIQSDISDSIKRATYFLQDAVIAPDLLWIEKVTYSSLLLTKSYRLAALKAAITSPKIVGRGIPLDITERKISGYHQMYNKTPMFSSTPAWLIRASLIEGSLFLPLLRTRHLEIFPRRDMEEDKYFEIVPFTWTGCTNRRAAFSSPAFLYDMMRIAILDYQADEFMEAVAGSWFSDNLPKLVEIIEDLFRVPRDVNGIKAVNGTENGVTKPIDTNVSATDGETAEYVDARECMRRFVKHVMEHPSVVAASLEDKENLRREFRLYFLAQVDQIKHNQRFGAQDQQQRYLSPQTSFFQWVKETAARHVACPFTYAWALCVVPYAVGNMSRSQDGPSDYFTTAEEKYYAADMCLHLATMCRMYNDHGSAVRDGLEKNVNSLHFPEFARTQGGSPPKDALFKLAEYERSCWQTALARLEAAPALEPNFSVRRIKERRMAVLRTFMDTVDLYGQIYVVKDIASRMVPAQPLQ
ncbi:ent-kaurene synthase [Colletotrichum navitas]|uniref:Ent-kaurene synthase n=1 Tax=Colletotrichum navitas TaxID=681940 RepID=A0AAD8V869_9PEZI|nr:ent-kaurene synthase [Colletotrichum navitas]KAK1595401.1 ent-kaurene synthase [Colletotrichum navitas]